MTRQSLRVHGGHGDDVEQDKQAGTVLVPSLVVVYRPWQQVGRFKTGCNQDFFWLGGGGGLGLGGTNGKLNFTVFVYYFFAIYRSTYSTFFTPEPTSEDINNNFLNYKMPENSVFKNQKMMSAGSETGAGLK